MQAKQKILRYHIHMELFGTVIQRRTDNQFLHITFSRKNQPTMSLILEPENFISFNFSHSSSS